MRKVADLQLLGFIELYKIIKEKFSQYEVNLESQNDIPKYIEIYKSPSNESEHGEIYLEIINPLFLVSNPENIATDSGTITLGINVIEASSKYLKISKKRLDDERFIKEIGLLIGKIAPVRKAAAPDVWHSEIDTWLADIIEKSKISDFCISISDTDGS